MRSGGRLPAGSSVGIAVLAVVAIFVPLGIAASAFHSLAAPTYDALGVGTHRPGAVVPSPSTTPQPKSELSKAQLAALWPLPEACFNVRTRGHQPSATDRKILGTGLQAMVVADYPVRADSLGPATLGLATTGAANSCHHKLWNVVRAVYPPKELALIERFIVFEGAAGEDTEGFVEPDNSVGTRWTLAISIANAPDDQVAQALVHELGHLISLNPTEVDMKTDSSNGCDTYPTSGACSLPGSILDGYVKTWPRAELKKWYSIDEIVNNEAHDRALADLYNQNSADFVSKYAATDPDEDFAETFAYWCLGAPLQTPTLAAKAAFISSRREVAGMAARCQLFTSTHAWSPDF